MYEKNRYHLSWGVVSSLCIRDVLLADHPSMPSIRQCWGVVPYTPHERERENFTLQPANCAEEEDCKVQYTSFSPGSTDAQFA